MSLSLSIVIPVFNESSAIKASLQRLQELRTLGAEVIVVDGGSEDDTVALCQAGADRVLVSSRGRARQMNAGAAAASGRWLLFLHADTWLPDNITNAVMAWEYSRSKWGFFFVRLTGDRWILRVIAWFMNRRSYYTSISTGDQCQFVEREVFEDIGGFANIPLMEDIELSKRLKRIGRPLIVVAKAETSNKKWQDEGVLRTVILMWRMRLAYYFGATPEQLVKKYYPSR